MSQGVIENVIIRYPHLVEPWSSQPTIEPDYNCQFILLNDWPGWAGLQGLVDEAIREKFGANVPANLKLPWLNKYLQPNIQGDGPYQGSYCINASGKGTKPGVVGPDAQPLDDLQVKTLIFSGCIVNALVGFYGYPSGPGVGCALNGIQLVNNQVERIPDAGRNVADAFQAIPGAPPAVMPAFQQAQTPVTAAPVAPGAPGTAPVAPGAPGTAPVPPGGSGAFG